MINNWDDHMSEIYMVPVDMEMTNEQYDQLRLRVSDSKASAIKKYLFRMDAIRSLTGESMIRHIISQKYDMENHDISFRKNAFSKPFVKDLSSFHFNISHAGKWVVCAIDSRPIGIDIEKVKKIDLQIANRFFSKTEVNDLYRQSYSDQTDYFYKLWTLKESYIKMVGRGLSISLDSFSCSIQPDNHVTFNTECKTSDVYLKLYEPDSCYKMSICQTHEQFPLKINYLTIDEILG